MRVSNAQAAENRARVVEVASELFRRRGFDGVGLKEVMENAGLTQGGFYKQFGSKGELIAEACDRAMETTARQLTDVASAAPEDSFGALIDFYLSTEHRDAVGQGCPVAALGSDVGRADDAVKAAFEAGVKARIGVIEDLIAESEGACSRETSMAVLSTMVGALLLSRTMDDADLSRKFLDSAADEIRRVVGRG
jgi:TetR/AcrR family transcriptional repressor of nem operon